MDLMVKSMLDLRQLESFALSTSPRYPSAIGETPVPPDLDLGSTVSLQTISAWVSHLYNVYLLYNVLKENIATKSTCYLLFSVVI